MALGADRSAVAGSAVTPVWVVITRVCLIGTRWTRSWRAGMQWNALSATGICSSSSAHRRFQEWERAGVFHEIWRQGLLEYDSVVGIDWAWLACDGAITKALLGGPKTGPNPTARAKKGSTNGFVGLGVDRGVRVVGRRR